MTIREYIQTEIFGRRAREHGSLVIYDPSRRYHDIASAMASDKCKVIDVSQSVIEQREAATSSLLSLAEGHIDQLVIWVPAATPDDDEKKQRDPFFDGLLGALIIERYSGRFEVFRRFGFNKIDERNTANDDLRAVDPDVAHDMVILLHHLAFNRVTDPESLRKLLLFSLSQCPFPTCRQRTGFVGIVNHDF